MDDRTFNDLARAHFLIRSAILRVDPVEASLIAALEAITDQLDTICADAASTAST